MKYSQFIPPEETDDGPAVTKDALLLQIEADHYAAVQRGDKKEAKRLEERHKKVSNARGDSAARNAYKKDVEGA